MTKKIPEFNPNFFIPPWLDLINNSSKKNSYENNDAIERLEKKIKELKSVEQWLKLNLNILESTIQGLEIQKNTISSLTTATKPKKNSKTNKEDYATQFSNIMANPTLLWWKSVEDQMEEILKASAEIKTPKKSSSKKKGKVNTQQRRKSKKRLV